MAVVIRFETLNRTEGLWCPECRLPSGVDVALAMHSGDQTYVLPFRRCADCGGMVEEPKPA